MTNQPMNRGLGGAVGALQLHYPMSLGVFDRYEDAQRSVDYLSDHEFPVEDVMIVGTELKQIERVTGRLSWGKVLGAGAMSGAWLGAFVGLVLSLVDNRGLTLLSLLSTVLFGVIFGAAWAAAGYAFTRGRRDFTSVSQVVATKYEVLTEHKNVARARELLTRMDPMRAAQEQVRLAQEEERARAAAEAPTPPPASPEGEPRG